MIDPGTQVLRCFLGRVEHEKKRKMYRLIGYIVISLALSVSTLAAYQVASGTVPAIPIGVVAFLACSWALHRVRVWRIRRAVFRSG